VRKFEMALSGLDRELQERQQENQQQGQQGQQQGPQSDGDRPRPLVPPDAEIRMILVMQRTLNEERKNFFESRPDLDSRELSDSEKARLKRLYHQQGSLAELFDNLRQNLLGDGGGPAEMPPEEENR
jgi:hypothetical protein